VFGIISVFSAAFFIIYFTGSPNPEDDFQQPHDLPQYALQALTVLNITSSRYKVYLSFFYSTTVIAALALYHIAVYLNKFRTNHSEISLLKAIFSFKNETYDAARRKLIDLHALSQDPTLLQDKELTSKFYTEPDLAEHSVMLRNLPKNRPASVIRSIILKTF
jgi:hypothetical protein